MVKNRRVIEFDRPVYVKSWASAVGKRESDGPLSKYFDLKFQDDLMDQKSWENAEKELVIRAAELCAAKGEMSMGDLVMMGRLYVGYYTTQWYVEDGKSVRADDDCADDTLRLLKGKFSSSPFVIYEKSSRDLYKEMEERD